MDPISQAALGAGLAQSFAKDKANQKSALVIGALAGMAPDLDVLIRSSTDPILFLEFHRQFTHALIFIPFGALLCALVFYQIYKSSLSFKQVYVFSFLGFATHGLLDACTSYGTQLLWPFSNVRIAWNTVSIIDPLFTLPIIVLIVLAAKKKNIFYARISFAYAVLFLALGVIQNNRAEKVLYELAAQRNHQVERIHVKPSFANRHLWKLIYEYDGRYYIDAVKLLNDVEIIPGTSIQKLDVQRDFPWLPMSSQQAKDIERFRWFSDDFLAVSPKNSMLITDVRYSFLPNKVKSMWGITLDKNKIGANESNSHVAYEMKRTLNKEIYNQFIDMLF